MPAIFAVIAPMLTWFAKFMAIRFALAIGVFVGSTVILNQFFEVIKNKIEALPGMLSGPGLQVFQMSGVGDAALILLAAYNTAILIKGLRNLAPGA